MTSTPARSRASTKISRPNISGPTSALPAEDAFVVFLVFAVAFVLLIRSMFCGRRSRVTKNPRPFPAVGCCRNCYLPSTSPSGVAAYDDYQQVDLYESANHRAENSGFAPGGSSLDSGQTGCFTVLLVSGNRRHCGNVLRLVAETGWRSGRSPDCGQFGFVAG